MKMLAKEIQNLTDEYVDDMSHVALHTLRSGNGARYGNAKVSIKH